MARQRIWTAWSGEISFVPAHIEITGPARTGACRRAERRIREERMDDRDQAIDELLAKQEITEAIFKYCRSMDRCDHELGKSVFHPDARVDYGAQMYQGSGYGFVDMALSGHTGAF